MKSLFVIRHAKSSWDLTNIEDIDRPLNDRGKADAPEMAKRLLKEKVKIDAFISSPAKRAKKTAQLFVHEFKRHKDEIVYIDELYNAQLTDFYKVLTGIDEAWNAVALFSHNPGITQFANSLTPVNIDNMPTCGIFAVRIPIGKWENFEQAGKEFWFFNYPKIKE
ncbi:MAG: histidine phosphatase family protein [Chitinophagaceae bacterium]